MTRWLTRYRREMVHAVRMTAASITAFGLVYALGRSEALWAVITAIVVTQSSIGGSLKVAFDQFVGSLFGAVYATTIVLVISPDDPLLSVVALVAALAPLSMLAALSAGFRIAPITGAIMLLGGIGLEVGPLGFVANRILEVGLGYGAGVLVSVLVVPAQASRSVLETTVQVANLIAQQLGALAPGGIIGQADLGSLAVRTRESLIRLETLVEGSARERRSCLTDVPDTEPFLRTMRRLRHGVDMLRRAARGARRDELHEQTAKPWLCAIEAGAATLRRIGHVLSGQDAIGDLNNLAQAVRAYGNSLEEMRRAGPTHSLSTAALGRLFGIGVALEQFRRDLDDLVGRSREIAASATRVTVRCVAQPRRGLSRKIVESRPLPPSRQVRDRPARSA